MGYQVAIKHKQRDIVLVRLNRIEGHVKGIKKMVEEDRDCTDLLHQLAAVKASVGKLSQIILEDHIESCLLDAVKSGKADTYVTDLKTAISKLL